MKTRTSRLLLFILLFSMIVSLIPPIQPPTVRAASTWYVSVGHGAIAAGNDGWAGTFAAPFKTIQKAMNVSANGDTIYLRTGNYNSIWEGNGAATSGWEITHSGTSTAQPFTLATYPGDLPNKAVLDGTGYSFTAAYGILTVGRLATHYNNVTISNISIQNSSQCGLCLYTTSASNGCNDVRITNCDFDEIYENAIVQTSSTTGWGYRLRIDNCTFTNIQHTGSMGECITLLSASNYIFEYNDIGQSTKQLFNPGGKNGIVRYNHFANINYYGLKIDPNANGDLSVHDIDIYGNLFTGAGYAALIIEPETANNHVYNIDIYNNIFDIDPYALYQFGIKINVQYGTQTIEDVNIYYNTIYTSSGSSSTGLYFYNGGTLDDIILANNIFICSGTSTRQVYFLNLAKAQTAVSLSHNCYWKTNGAVVGCVYTDDSSDIDATSLADDPECDSPYSSDFHLNTTSPCIGAADTTYTVSYDYDLVSRPQSGTYDIGAYEYYPTGSTPTVTTNTTTSIGSIHAVVNGAILDNGTMDIITYGFEYGITPSFGSEFISYGNYLGAFSQGAYFSAGQIYYIRAYATNAYATGYGSTLTFVTQPYPPVSLTGTSTNATTIALTWAKGTGANYTRIQRSTTGYPSSIADGSNTYNGTASLYSNTGLTPGTLYYYRAWSMTKWGTDTKWNSTAYSSTYTLTRPEAPTSLIGNQCANLTHTWVNWTNGTGKDYNVVVKKVGGIPGDPADGTVVYNGTANHTLTTVTSGDNNYYRVWSLAKETSPSTSAWSTTAPYVSISGIIPGSLITVHPGVYFSVGNTNYSVGITMNFTQIILTSSNIQFNDTNFSTVPTPTSTKVNITLNYLHDDTTMTIPGTLLINMSVDTVVSTVPISWTIQGLHPVMSYAIYHNSISESFNVSDATGTITFINESGAWDGTTQYYEIYFLSGGPYGGLTIGVYNETDKIPLIFNCTIVNHTGSESIVYRNQTGSISISMATLPKGEQVAVIVDARNHEMRTYYFDIITGVNYNLEAYLPYTITPLLPTNITYLYYFTVIDEGGYTISDVRYYIYGLVNYTSYELMQDGYTDGNGKFDVWLLPGRLYKVTLSKTGYQNDTYDYITGTTDYTHIFKLLYETGGTTTTYYFNEQIHTSAYRNNNTAILYVNYTDDMSMTINCQVYIYEINGSTGASALFFSYTTTGDSDFTFNTPVNNSNSYEIIYKLNHSYFGYKTAYILIRGYKATFTTETEFNTMFVVNFGYNPFGWSNVITWFIMVGCFFSFNRRDSYMAMILAGFFLLVINFYIGFNTLIAGVAGGAIPVMMILFGILMLIRDRYRFGVDM